MLGLPDSITACLFDLDGVLTQTAKVHAAAWKETFDGYLRERAKKTGEEFKEFDKVTDYDEYVDGQPRYDGVRNFLKSRGIELPEGSPDDPPDAGDVCGIGNRKNELVLKLIKERRRRGLRGLGALRQGGARGRAAPAVVSSSANCRDVLDRGRDRGPVRGADRRRRRRARAPARASRRPTRSWPAPRRSASQPAQAAVFEDALAGVQAGRAGKFGYVVGVDRVGQAEALQAHGADVVVQDLAELLRDVVIEHPAFPVEPWAVRETELHLDMLAQTESVFALSNGHIGLRGNLDEGEPYGLPGTYLSGFYEVRPLPYAEAGYGYPEAGQTVVNVTNGKIIRLLVDDEPFDVRYGELRHHERVLDLRAGRAAPQAEWISPTGRRVRVVLDAAGVLHAAGGGGDRLRSSSRSTASSRSWCSPSWWPTSVARRPSSDPRAAAALASPLRPECYDARDDARDPRAPHPRERAAGGRRDGPRRRGPRRHRRTTSRAFEDLARVDGHRRPRRPGSRCGSSSCSPTGGRRSARRRRCATRSRRPRAGAQHTGWDGLLAEQRAYLDDFWERADVEVEGDAELQQAVRFALFHILQAGARGEQRAIAAKGLTGPGYDGHTFWDTEMFVLPVLTYTRPERRRRRAALAPRGRSTGPRARPNARPRGRRLPVADDRRARSARATGRPGTAAFHINADIADAVIRYLAATDDEDFERDVGLELLVETARLWRSLGHHDAARALPHRRRHRPRRVQRDRRQQRLHQPDGAAEPARGRRRRRAPPAPRGRAGRRRGGGGRAGATPPARWSSPTTRRSACTPQAEGFTAHQVWDFEATGPEQYPLLLHFPYFDLYRKQVVKQADLVLAMHLCGDAFTAEEKARDFAYYEPLTVRDSSLSACTQAVIAAEVGHLELAYDYFAEAALMDLDDLEHNTRDGIHIASLAGTWIAAVAGFGGMRDHDGQLSFSPRLPGALTRLTFRLMVPRPQPAGRGQPRARALLAARRRAARDPHHGERVTVEQRAAAIALDPAITPRARAAPTARAQRRAPAPPPSDRAGPAPHLAEPGPIGPRRPRVRLGHASRTQRRRPQAAAAPRSSTTSGSPSATPATARMSRPS